MARRAFTQLRLIHPLRRVRLRLALSAVVAVLAVGVGAGFAVAATRATLIGSGVVVIETNLGYENAQAAGTGMVLTSSGEVLTNNHVIRGATTIRIVVPGTGHSYTARVVGYDASADVAVLQATGASNLKSIAIGNSSAVTVGEAVTATGNAGGTGTLTSTSGTVTALAKSITVSDDRGATEHLTGLIEMSAALEAGDSGGPLLTSDGKVIGLDTAASVGYGFQEMSSSDGYAIPINKALAIAKKIETGAKSATVHVGGTAFLGVTVAPADYDTTGVVISGVLSGGSASVAGLTAGDIITAIGGHSVSSPATLESIVLNSKPGARASVTYLDPSGTTRTTTVTLASGPPQ